MSYIGNIADIPVGLAGLNGTNNPSLLRPEHLVRADTISYEAGVVKKEGGASLYSTAAIDGTTNVLGGWDWWPDATTQRQIAFTDNGKLFKDDGAGTFSTTLKSALTTTDANRVAVFVDGGKELAANNRKLFIFTGSDAVQVLSGNGATTANLATPPADWSGSNWPSCGCIHANRLWGAGNPNDPHRAYYSTISNQEDFTGSGAGSIAIYPGQGRKIVATVPFKGVIIVFKYPVGIYLIDTSQTVANWSVDKISDAVGAAGPLCIVPIENDLLFMAPDGQFHLLSAVVAQGAFGSKNLSIDAHMDDYVQKNLNLAKLPRAKGIFYPQKLEVHFAVPSLESSVLDMRVVLDFSQAGLPRYRYSTRDVCEALWMRQDADGVPRPLFGDADSRVWNLDQDIRSKNSAGYIGEFETAPTDLSHVDIKLATIRKNGEFLEVVTESLGNYNLNVDVIWDGNTVQTVTFLLGVTGGILGQGQIGSMQLAFSAVVTRKRRITGSGRRVSFRGYNSGAAEDFAVSRFLLHYWTGDDRAILNAA